MASAVIRDAWAQVWAVLRFCIFIAALGFAAGFYFHFGPKMADQKWRSAVEAYPWLAAAGEPADRRWFKLLFTPMEEVARTYAPQAIAGLVAQPILIGAEYGLAGAQQQIDRVNSFKAACAMAPQAGAIPACAAEAFAARFAAVKREFKGSAAARDYYLRYGDGTIFVHPLTLYQTKLCNAGGARITVTAAPVYHADDERQDGAQSTAIAPGQCGVVFWAKLQQAPKVDIEAVAEPRMAAWLGHMAGYNAVWNGGPVRWTLASTYENATAEAYELTDPGLCFGRDTPVCGGVVVDDRLAYAAKFDGSLRNQRAQPHAILAKFIIGVMSQDPVRRDEIGPLIVAVSPGSPAAALGLQPGDRILEVNGVTMFRMTEVQRAIDGAGRTYGWQTPIRLTILSGGQIREGSVAPTFNKAYFDRLGYGWKSFFISAADLITLGNADNFDCTFIRPFRRDGFTHAQCLAQWVELREVINVLYSRQRFFGAFLGGIISPLRVIARALGFVVAEGFATHAAVEFAEAAITERSLPGPPRSGGEYLKDTLRTAAPAIAAPIFIRRLTP